MQLQKSSVIKIGGSLLSSRNFPKLISALVPYLKKNPAVLVHGGGKEISSACACAGRKTRFIRGRRFTDKQTIKIVEAVLCKKLNPLLVKWLKKYGLPAIGSASLGKKIVLARRIHSLGYVGIPQKIRKDKIRLLMDKGFLPVFASVATTPGGTVLNINADEFASAIAKSLRAERLILFTDVAGILNPSGKTIPRVVLSNGKKLLRDRSITGGMIPKLNSALDALRAGVKEIWILQGKLPLSSARGTLLTKDSKIARHPFLP